MTSMIESSPLAGATHTSLPQPPACPAACGAGEWSGLSARDEGWVFSFSLEGVIPTKMQWLGQEFYADIKQQNIDDVLGKAWKTEKSNIEMMPTQNHPFHDVAPAVKKLVPALYLSLAAMSQAVLGRIAPGEPGLPSATENHDYDHDLGVFFMSFDKHAVRIPVPDQNADAQSLTWVLDNIATLKISGIRGLVIDALQDADEHLAPIIVGLLDDIEISGLPLFAVQEMPAKLLRVRDLDDLIVEDSRLSFVVSGLMNRCGIAHHKIKRNHMVCRTVFIT